jgi:transposase InsO family protein
LYYVPKKEKQDWQLKCQIEAALQEHPSYGSRRIAHELSYNRKRIKRVMRKFGLKPYRRRSKKWRNPRKIQQIFENLLVVAMPMYPHHIWTSDFTELAFHGHKVYVATVLDLFTRQVVGLSVMLRKGAPLVIQALWSALLRFPRPEIFHSDNGKEYEAATVTDILRQFGVLISRSRPGCPWENGYQESWYSGFKVDLGDPNRFASLGELVAEIYRLVWDYNHRRIHSAFKMPPAAYANQVMYQKTALKMAA